MKTNEELNALKEEVETMNKKLAELSEEEFAQVFGGFIPSLPPSRSGEGPVFKGHIDGNSETVHLNIGPEGYDCSGLVD